MEEPSGLAAAQHLEAISDLGKRVCGRVEFLQVKIGLGPLTEAECRQLLLDVEEDAAMTSALLEQAFLVAEALNATLQQRNALAEQVETLDAITTMLEERNRELDEEMFSAPRLSIARASVAKEEESGNETRLLSDLEALESENAQLKADTREHERVLRQMAAELDARNSLDMNPKASIIRRLDVANNNRVSLQVEVEILRAENMELVEEMQRVKDQNATSASVHDKTVRELENDLAQMHISNVRMHAEHYSDDESANAEVEQYKKHAEKLLDEVTCLRDMLAQMQHSQNKLTRSSGDYSEATLQAQAEEQALREKREKEVAQLKKQVCDLQLELDVAKLEITTKVQDVKFGVNDDTRDTEELETIRLDKILFENQAKRDTEELETIRLDKILLENEAKTLHSELLQVTAELTEMKNKVGNCIENTGDIQAECDKTKADLESSKKWLHWARNEIDRCHKALGQGKGALSQKLTDSQENLSSTTVELHAALRVQCGLLKEIALLQQAQEDMRRTNREKMEELRLESQMQIDELHETLEQSRAYAQRKEMDAKDLWENAQRKECLLSACREEEIAAKKEAAAAKEQENILLGKLGKSKEMVRIANIDLQDTRRRVTNALIEASDSREEARLARENLECTRREAEISRARAEAPAKCLGLIASKLFNPGMVDQLSELRETLAQQKAVSNSLDQGVSIKFNPRVESEKPSLAIYSKPCQLDIPIHDGAGPVSHSTRSNEAVNMDLPVVPVIQPTTSVATSLSPRSRKATNVHSDSALQSAANLRTPRLSDNVSKEATNVHSDSAFQSAANLRTPRLSDNVSKEATNVHSDSAFQSAANLHTPRQSDNVTEIVLQGPCAITKQDSENNRPDDACGRSSRRLCWRLSAKLSLANKRRLEQQSFNTPKSSGSFDNGVLSNSTIATADDDKSKNVESRNEELSTSKFDDKSKDDELRSALRRLDAYATETKHLKFLGAEQQNVIQRYLEQQSDEKGVGCNILKDLQEVSNVGSMILSNPGAWPAKELNRKKSPFAKILAGNRVKMLQSGNAVSDLAARLGQLSVRRSLIAPSL